MVGGCPVDLRLLGCLYDRQPEELLVLLVVLSGFFIVSIRRWTGLLYLAAVLLGILAIWKL